MCWLKQSIMKNRQKQDENHLSRYGGVKYSSVTPPPAGQLKPRCWGCYSRLCSHTDKFDRNGVCVVRERPAERHIRRGTRTIPITWSRISLKSISLFSPLQLLPGERHAGNRKQETLTALTCASLSTVSPHCLYRHHVPSSWSGEALVGDDRCHCILALRLHPHASTSARQHTVYPIIHTQKALLDRQVIWKELKAKCVTKVTNMKHEWFSWNV